MKRFLSVIAALIWVITCCACSGDTAETASSPPPDDTASDSSVPTLDIHSETSEAAGLQAPADPSENRDEIGFFYSGVDPQSRDTYNIYYTYPSTLLLFEMMTQSFSAFGDTLNFTITPTTTEGDLDAFITNFEIFATQGIDGFIVSYDTAAKDRITEVLDDTGIPYISLFNSILDEDGHSIVPTIGLDQYEAGEITLQWLYDHYKTYWGDADTSKLGLISLTYTTSIDLKDRGDGSEALFAKLFPDNTDYIFVADCATSSDLTADAGYNQVAAIVAGHPEIEYWFVTSCLEMYSQGAARAAESLNIEDHMLITDVGSDILCSEWETGYNGSWVCCLAISNYLYAAPTVCGLVAMIDGVSTPGSLWPDMLKDGDTAAFYTTASQVVTKDNYKDYFNGIAEIAGMVLPYPG